MDFFKKLFYIFLIISCSCSIRRYNTSKIYQDVGFIIVYSNEEKPQLEKSIYNNIFFIKTGNTNSPLNYILNNSNLNKGFSGGITFDQVLFLEKHMETLKCNNNQYLSYCLVKLHYTRPLRKKPWKENVHEKEFKNEEGHLSFKYTYELISPKKIVLFENTSVYRAFGNYE